jgi:DMSO reductase family type II enzyme chaperone
MSTTLQSPAVANQARDAALCRSILYEAIALGFRRPSARTLQRLGTPDAVAALAEAAAFLDDEVLYPATGRAGGLAGRVRALAAAPVGGALETLAACHLDLFGHTVRGPVPAYETEYGDDTLFQKPQEMSDIAGFLAAFGLVVDPLKRERIDHISCQLEFVAFLARKEAHAIESRDAAMREETRRATRLFLKDHLGRFVPSFARRVVAKDPVGFYARMAELCVDFVRMECERYEASLGPEMLRLRLPIDDGAPIACGVPDGCAVPGRCGPGDGGGGVAG